MPLTLPRAHVLAAEQMIVCSRHHLLDEAEEAMLIALDGYRRDRDERAGDRVVPLQRGRYAVGRGTEDGTIWRVVEQRILSRPPWIWTADAWFLPDVGEQAPKPRELPLRELMARGLPLAGSAEQLQQTLGAAITALRNGEKVAVLAPAAALRSPIHSGRWFTLALLYCLPDDLAPTLAMSCWEPCPEASHWDLVIVSEAPEGFTVIDASNPPQVTEDPVALFVMERLANNDPETLEASSALPDVGLEMWTGSYEAVINAGEFEGVDPELYRTNPSLATWVLIGKLDEGVAMTDSFAEEIAQATEKLGDPRIWEVCAERSTGERIKAISALLAMEPLPTPGDELLRALARARPPGRVVAPWANALLTWMRAGVEPSLTESLLLETVVEDDEVFDPISRSSVFSELMIRLIEAGRYGEVLAHLLGPTAHTLLDTIGGGPLVVAWLHIDRERRTLSALQQLVDTIAGASDADRAVAGLYRGLLAQGEAKRAEMVIHQWARVSLRFPHRERDALVEALRGTDNAVEWVQVVAAEAPEGRISHMVRAVTSSRADSLWSVALNERAIRRAETERDRLLLVRELIPAGDEALEPEARELFAAAMPDLTWPDRPIAGLAARLAEVRTATQLWMWVAITGAAPGQFPDDTVEATVEAFMANPPHIELEREASLRCTAGLALASDWSPFEHARWLVWLIMAPDDGTEFHLLHAQRLMRAMTERGDGPERIAEITNAFVELPPEHPALLVFLHRLLPGLFGGPAPEPYTRRVDRSRMNQRIQTIWQESVAMQRNPLGLFRR